MTSLERRRRDFGWDDWILLACVMVLGTIRALPATLVAIRYRSARAYGEYSYWTYVIGTWLVVPALIFCFWQFRLWLRETKEKQRQPPTWISAVFLTAAVAALILLPFSMQAAWGISYPFYLLFFIVILVRHATAKG